jgi:uncharacterized membrane protein
VERNYISRIFAVLLLSLVIGALIHHNQERGYHMGKQAFMDKQSQAFDKQYAKPHPAFAMILGMAIVLLPIFGIYELLASLIYKLIAALDSETPAQPPPIAPLRS